MSSGKASCRWMQQFVKNLGGNTIDDDLKKVFGGTISSALVRRDNKGKLDLSPSSMLTMLPRLLML
jgi:hypothetical protein